MKFASGLRRTIAHDALAAGRPGLASSFRFHRPRGPMCGRGYCSACEIETAEGRVLACQTPSTGRVPRRVDPLRPVGRVAERWPPWFYERRFLRTEALRRVSLDALRRLSAAGSLADGARPFSPRAFETIEAATVVVGAARPGDGLVLDAAAGDLALGVYPDRVLGALSGGRLLEIHFDRLVLATGAYERLPPIPGNDLPGVVGVHALERYAEALPARTRVAVWGPVSARSRVATVAAAHDLDLVWAAEAAPRRLSGRGRVERLHAEATIACDIFVAGAAQPALELAMQAGARVALTDGELPILVLDEAPGWLEVRGAAAAGSSGVPDVAAADDAFACLCEDVRVGDIRACVTGGFPHAELVKRRTGAMTGPCQGKICAPAVLAVLREHGIDAVPTTARPLARPATLGELAAHA